MDFSELISDFATRHHVADLTAEDGAVAIEVDGIAILLAAANDLLVTAEIGEPPPEGAAIFSDLLLESNLEMDAFFAKSKENGRYVLAMRLPFVGLDSESFDVALEAFVNRAEMWRRLLADYRPAAEAAAAAKEKEAPVISSGAFLQV